MTDPIRAAQPASPAEGEVGDEVLPPRVGHILRLAEIIRAVDGNHDKGAAALAEAILSHPDICSAGLATEGEVAELMEWLGNHADDWKEMGLQNWADKYIRIRDLLAQRYPAPVPAGIVPVEYFDVDSCARIVCEPAEEGSGSCWMVKNSHHISPFSEFSTAEAAWNALRTFRHALPLPAEEGS
jgi:hypothetical protein